MIHYCILLHIFLNYLHSYMTRHCNVYLMKRSKYLSLTYQFQKQLCTTVHCSYIFGTLVMRKILLILVSKWRLYIGVQKDSRYNRTYVKRLHYYIRS